MATRNISLTDRNDRLAEACNFAPEARNSGRTTHMHADPKKKRKRKIARASRQANRGR